MTFSPLTTRISGNGGQFSNRGRTIDHFVVHHAANSSLSGVLSIMSTGSRQVSSNYVVKDNDIVGVVPEEYRSWSLSSSVWDGRSITVETCNSAMGDASGWPISVATYHSLAKLIADCATRYNFPINRDRVLGHREVYSRHGASYATACPGGINLDRLVSMAKEYQAGTSRPVPEITYGDDMYLVRNSGDGKTYLVTAAGYRWINATTVSATTKITGRGVQNVTPQEFTSFVNDLHELIRNGPVLGDDDYNKIATAVKK